MADKRLTYVLTARDDASSSFAKVAAAAKASGYDIKKSYKDSSDESRTHISGLVAALTAVAPAAVPIGAVAVGAVAGLGATAGVAALGVLGIRDAMKEGTILGHQYQAAFKPITTEFTTLKQLAAQNMFAGINSAVKDSRALFPTLNRDVGLLSTQVGQIVAHAAPGLVSLFHTLNPLIVSLGGDLVNGAAKFQQWAQSSTGLKNFVAYAQTQLPTVERTLSEIAGAVSHLIVGLAPLGGASLTGLRLLATALNALPVGVIQAAAPAIAGVVLALKALSLLPRPVISGLQGISGAMSSLNVVALGAGLALSVYTSHLARNQQNAAKAQADTNDFSNALVQSKGAIDGQSTALAAQKLAQQGVFEEGAKLGLSQQTLTQAVLGNKSAMDQVTAATNGNLFANNALFPKVYALAQSFSKGQQSAHDQAAAQTGLNATTTMLGNTQSTAKIKIDGVTTSLTKEATASGLLKNALDRLNGTAISLEQTQNQFLDTLAGLTKRSGTYNGTLNQLNATGRANREVIVSAIRAANDHAQAVADQTAKTKGLAAGVEAGTADLRKHETAIRAAATAAGLDKTQVDALIRSIGRIPRVTNADVNVNGVVNADRNVQDLLRHINSLHSKNITIDYYETVHYIGAPNAGAGGHLAQHASGTDYFPGGMTWVGEQGAELVDLPRGSKIYTSSRSKQIAGSGGGDITVYVAGSVVTEADLVRSIRRGINTERRRMGMDAI